MVNGFEGWQLTPNDFRCEFHNDLYTIFLFVAGTAKSYRNRKSENAFNDSAVESYQCPMPSLLIRLRKQKKRYYASFVQCVSSLSYIVRNCCSQENKGLYFSQYYAICWKEADWCIVLSTINDGHLLLSLCHSIPGYYPYTSHSLNVLPIRRLILVLNATSFHSSIIRNLNTLTDWSTETQSLVKIIKGRG